MNITDPATLAQLRAAKERTEVRGLHGDLIGFFTPVSMLNSLFGDFAALLDEIHRRGLSKEPGYTTAEVLARLKSLEVECQRRKENGVPALTTDEAIGFIHSLRPSNQA